MKRAWIEADRIRDIAHGNPADLYCQEIAKHYNTDVPDEAENGDWWVDGKLEKPPKPVRPDPSPARIPPIGPIAFQLLFTPAELVACDAAKATDAQVRIFWKLLDDPRTDVVDRNIPSVQEAIRHLETVGCVVAGRADELINTTTC